MAVLSLVEIVIVLVVVCLVILSFIGGLHFAKKRYTCVLGHIQNMCANSYAVWSSLETSGSCPSGVGEDFALIDATCQEALNGIFESEQIDS